MPALDASLARLARYEDPQLGISETLLRPVLGNGSTVAVLSKPLGPAHPIGWVIMHSLGIEQVHLLRLDVLVARGLAAAGFPVLRYHGQGYGDSEGTAANIGLSSHLADATDAVALMREVAGVEQVGAIGARLGGTVAALVAEREKLAAIAMIEPIVSGSAYGRELLRRQAISGMMRKTDEDSGAHVAELRTELDTQGYVDLNGFRLTKETVDELAGVDLVKDVTRVRGPSLVVAISRTGRPGGRAQALADHLQAISGRSTLTTIQDSHAGEFGKFHYRTDAKTGYPRDTLQGVIAPVTDAVVDWSRPLGSGGGRFAAGRDVDVPARELA
jgi:pimeloyl-ACP methyl ester carboxylesterase